MAVPVGDGHLGRRAAVGDDHLEHLAGARTAREDLESRGGRAAREPAVEAVGPVYLDVVPGRRGEPGGQLVAGPDGEHLRPHPGRRPGPGVEDRAGGAAVDERDGQSLGAGGGDRVQVVRQRAGRPYARLLPGYPLHGRRHRGDPGVALPVRRGVRRGVREHRYPVVGAGEVKRGGEVAADRTPPRRDVRLQDAEPLLHEPDDRRVVEHLRADVAARAPRRHHDHRYALAQTVRAGDAGTRPGRSGLAVVELQRGVDGRGTGVGRHRGVRRHEVVEEAVVLVVGDEQRRAAPHLRVGGEGVQYPGDVPGAVVGRPVRVLAVRLRCDHIRHLRQRAVAYVGPQQLEQVLAGLGVGTHAGPVVQRVARLRVLVLGEIQQRVVPVVADVRIPGPAPESAAVQTVTGVLIHLPGHAGLLQAFRVRAPRVADLVVRDDRAATRTVVAGTAGPQVVPVWVGRPDQRAVVVVADGERVGEGVVERDVITRQIHHRGR